MQPADLSVESVPPAIQGDTHVDRLNALRKRSVQPGLADAERIRAMAPDVLDMDLVVLGEFGATMADMGWTTGWHFGRPQLA